MLARMTDVWAPWAQLGRQMDRMFEEFFEDAPAARSYGGAYPQLNAWADDDGAYVEAELPGLSMDDVEVLVNGNTVTIGGERKSSAPAQGNASCYRSERGTGKFSRTMTLPWEIDADKVEAKLTDGVLLVRLPKTEKARPKKIAVHGS